MSLKIIGTGHSVPDRSVSNTDLENMIDTSDEWIKTRTGIESRFVSTGHTLTELAAGAGAQALERAGIPAEKLDLIICSTIRGDNLTPSLACTVQKKLGASCPAFDLNAACSGFIYALDTADSYITSGKAENILIISAEMMSEIVDWSDRSVCVLFGDGAGAAVVTKGNALKYIHLTATGDDELLYARSGSGNNPFSSQKPEDKYLHMNGQEVFKYAVSVIEKESAAALEALNISADSISLYLLHQANKRIIDFARSRLNQPKEKFPINIGSYGNTSSASVPILLDELVTAGQIKKGDLLLLSAFGAGLTSGTCVIEWE